MIKSMTGFGRSELKIPGGTIRVEIKTTNHKFLETSCRLPGHLSEYEDTVRKKISQDLRRGKINLFLSAPDPSIFSAKLVLNEPLAREVCGKIKKLRGVLKMKPEPGESESNFLLREVLRYPDVLTRDVSSNGRGHFQKDLEKAVGAALQNLARSRTQEGAALTKDLLKRAAEILLSVKAIEKRLPEIQKEVRKSLEKKARELLKDGQIDRERLTSEATLYAKNGDISEEVTRLKTHVDAMKKALKESGEVGRKIDFLGQEMTREANTMGAKSNDVAIANHVIHIKSTIEKIREQAQNVE